MNALKSDRFWLVGGILAAIVVAALAWFVAVGPELSKASSLDSQTIDAQTQNLTLQSNIRKLQRENADMTALTAALQQARTALPVDTNIAAYTRLLSDYAAKNHVQVTGISAATPVSGTAKPGQPAARAASSAAGQLYALPLTVIVKGAIADDLKYLRAVQTDPRAALVTSTQLANDASKTSNLTQLTIQLQVYVAPQTPEVAAELQKQLATTSK
jgi:Tfp pilus assembly protein PilO